jgi:hypothetical protein
MGTTKKDGWGRQNGHSYVTIINMLAFLQLNTIIVRKKI